MKRRLTVIVFRRKVAWLPAEPRTPALSKFAQEQAATFLATSTTGTLS